jgi:hypothetical protein
MVSFRNSQFQAILVGMVIADAVSQGQLPWQLDGAPVATANGHTRGAIATDDWSHQLAAELTPPQPALNAVGLAPRLNHIGAITAESPTVVALLICLPHLLRNLDQSDGQSGPRENDAQTRQAGTSIIFYHCLQASLRQDAAALYALRQQLDPGSSTTLPPSQIGLGIAIDTLLTAPGDFQLAVGQNLQSLTAPAGSVILTAILSAAWGDLPSVPVHYRHWLQQPYPRLQAWLQRRWHIPTGVTLMLWAEHLDRQWAGQSLMNVERSPLLAVQPSATNPAFPHL